MPTLTLMMMQTALEEYYHRRVAPSISQAFACRNKGLQNHSQTTPSTTLDGFEYAFSLVSSRAFLVDAYHGLAMVPIADMYVNK